METLLLHITIRKWYMAYKIVAIPNILSDLQDHAPITCVLNAIFRTLCSSWQHFNWHVASRGPSVIAELLVLLVKPQPSQMPYTSTPQQTEVMGFEHWGIFFSLSLFQAPSDKNLLSYNVGQLPNAMAALPNIGGALCQRRKVWLTSTTTVPCSNAAKMRNLLKLFGVPQINEKISAASRRSSPYCGGHGGRYCCLTIYFDCRYVP